MSPSPADRTLAVPRPLVLALCALGGAVLCVAGIAVHRQRTGGVPWGIVLVLVTVFVVATACGLLAERPGTVLFSLGYVVLLLLVLGQRAEGDYLIASDPLGYGFLLGSVIVLGIAVVRTPRQG